MGGHCIPDDPLYLYWKAKQYGFSSKFIKLSADTNLAMPQYAIDRLKAFLKENGKSFSRANILVVGVTYKKDVKDLRKSPPLRLIELLKKAKVRVSYHDPIIPYLNIDSIKMTSIELKPNIVSSFDCVLIATDHTAISYQLILKNAKLIFDIRNVYRGADNVGHPAKIMKL